MTRTPVQSSSIHSIGHDPKTGTLEVKFFSGGVYQYDDVNADEYRNLMTAKSVGSHFHAFIRGTKQSRKIE